MARRSAAEPVARTMWRLLEPVHAVVYWAPEVRANSDRLGLRGGWMSYFGCRAAPLGAVSSAVVTAVFYGFHPAMVARAVPDVWSAATPQALVQARIEGMDLAIRRVFGDLLHDGRVHAAAQLARRAAELCNTAGRPLAAGNLELEWPQEDHLLLWQAATVLREHRGDGHVAALVGHQVSPLAAHITSAAAGGPPRDHLQSFRQYSDQEWSAEVARLTELGWLTPTGRLSARGRAVRRRVEEDTDRLAGQPWQRLGAELTADLADLLAPLTARAYDSGAVPAINPIGVSRPTTAR